MPTFDFTSPEGKHYSVEGPAGATAAQAFQILQQHLSNSVTQPEQDQMSSGILSTIGNDISNAAGSAWQGVKEAFSPSSAANQAYIEQQKSGSPLDISSQIGHLGTVAGGALSALGIPGSIFAPVGKEGGKIYDALAPQFTSQQKQELANSGVNLKTGEQVVNMALAGLSPRGASPIGIEPAAAAPLAPKQLPSPDLLKSEAASIYNKPSIRAIRVTPKSVADIGRSISTDFKRSGFNEADQPGVFRVLEEIKSAGAGRSSTGQVLPWPNVDKLDTWSKRLGKIAKETQFGMGGPEPTQNAAAAMQLKGKIDALLAQKVPDWMMANQNYAAAKVAQGLNKRALTAQIKAEGGTGDFAARLKSSATQMLTNPKLTRGLSKDELNMLKSISEGSATQRALTWFANLLGNRITYGAGALLGGGAGLSAGPIGGALGAIGGATLDAGARLGLMKIRNALAARQAANLSNSVLARSPLAQSLAVRNFPQLAIPSNSVAALLAARAPSSLPAFTGMMPAYANQNQNRRRR